MTEKRSTLVEKMVGLGISKKDSKEIIKEVCHPLYSPVNWAFGWQHSLSMRVNEAYQKKLSGNDAHKFIYENFVCPECYNNKK